MMMGCVFVQYAVWLPVTCFSTSQPISPVCHCMTATHTQGSAVGPVQLSHSSQSCPPVWLYREGALGSVVTEGGGAATTNAGVATRGMAVEGYFLLLCSAAFLVTPIPPSQSVNLARLLKHKTDSTSLLFSHTHTHTRCTRYYYCAPTPSFFNKKQAMTNNDTGTVGRVL